MGGSGESWEVWEVSECLRSDKIGGSKLMPVLDLKIAVRTKI